MSPVLRQQEVGAHVRKLRLENRFSLRALAARTDFSPSFISQLENGRVSPSIHSMEKIAAALGASLSVFFAAIGAGEGGLVLRKSERGHLPSQWSRAEVESLARGSPRRLDPLLITLHPGGRSGKHPMAQREEEFALILKGRAVLRLGPDEFRLGPGDSVTLVPGELRLWLNQSRRITQVLVVRLRAG